jgi:hypothetical protein
MYQDYHRVSQTELFGCIFVVRPVIINMMRVGARFSSELPLRKRQPACCQGVEKSKNK